MAGVGVNWTRMLVVAVFLLGAERVSFAQSAQFTPAEEYGSLSGRVTGLYSKPLSGVALVARNQLTGAEARTITTKNGAYLFNKLPPGEYTVQAQSSQLGLGQVGEIVVNAGHEAHVQAAMEFTLSPPRPELLAAGSEKPTRVEPKLGMSRPDPSPLPPLLSNPAVAAKPTTLTGQPLPVARERSAEKAPAAKPAALPSSISQPATTTPEPAKQTMARLSPAEVIPSGHKAAITVAATGLSKAVASEQSAAMMAAATRAAQAAAMQIAQALYMPVEAASKQSGLSADGEMNATELQSLPVSGRHWQDFVLDNSPASTTPAGGQAEISLAGAGQQSVEYSVDGSERRLAFGASNSSGEGSEGRGPLGQGEDGPAGMAQVGVGGHGFAVSEAAIRTVATTADNMDSAAARAASGRMNVETQRGGDRLRGQGFFFDRQNTWGARNPFTQLVRETAPFTPNSIPTFTSKPYTPPDREMTWGIGAGSRIRHKKLFWFSALDGHQRNDPGLSTVRHPDKFFAQPSNDQMQVLSARLGLSNANPVAEGIAAYSKLLETLDGLLGSSPRNSIQWTGFGRIDWTAAERHRLTLEGTGARWNAPGGGLSRVTEVFGNHSFGSTKASQEWMLGRWEAFLTPNLLIVTQASFGHDLKQARPSTPSAFEQSFLNGNAWGQLPQMVVDSSSGFTIGNPSRFGSGSYPDERTYRGQESIDWIRGKLLVRAGLDFSHSADITSLLNNQTGTYHYTHVEDFVSDALVFQSFGLSGELNPYNQRNCDQTGRVWRDSLGKLRGLGSLPCYSYYSQSMGPASWHLSTNDWAGYATAQWQAGKLLVVSAGLRWEREQMPPPLEKLKNPELPVTGKLPSLGNNWAPRVSLALGSGERGWPVLRVGYGMYFSRVENSAIETVLTHTGSFNGDMNFFVRPLDGFNPPTGTSDAPPFPHVFAGPPASVVKPGAVAFAPGFHNPEVHQAVAALEESLPGHFVVTGSAMMSLARRLPVSIDTNLAPPTPVQTITYEVVDATGLGPIKSPQITLPFYASWPANGGSADELCPDSRAANSALAGRPCPGYQQITAIMSRANSTYEAAMFKLARNGRRGLSLHASYTYAHAMDWNPNEGSQAAGNDVLDPGNFALEYGTSNLDRRHSAGATVIYESPWKVRGPAGRFANHWMVSSVGQYRSGLPYSMRTVGSLAQRPVLTTNGVETIVALGPGINGSGGDNRVYGLGSDNRFYNAGRNTYRYPATWKADLRLAKRFDMGSMRQLELLAESFNLLNHQNVTEVETTGYTIGAGTLSGGVPTLNFLTGLKANSTAFGKPQNVNATNFYRERQIQFGLRMRF